MTQNAYAPAVANRTRDTSPLRCAASAWMDGESLHASAVRYRRFLLLEAPGPWGSSAFDERHMDPALARELSARAKAADVHVLLIRRPGRHPSAAKDAGPRVMAWAFADTTTQRVLWGAWRAPQDLLSLDLNADVPGEANAVGPQRLALVCTNGKRDQCCALRGRPVAAAIAAATDWDTWECSHLGGHRFAATMMLLPTGDMYGWLDQDTSLDVLRQFDAGQVATAHYRGRAGQPAPVQAALHAAAVRLGDFRRDALRVSAARPAPGQPDGDGGSDAAGSTGGLWEVEVIHRTGPETAVAYRVVVAASQVEPRLLSCSDSSPKAETLFETLSFSPVEPASAAGG